ncbi:MAG TPA: hypothetical protein PKZ97_14930, partial [Azospirillaceae bacterium]|nr:hypothetical protein [Azospirillaceae bacterium]
EDRLRVGLVGEFPAYEASILGRQDAPVWDAAQDDRLTVNIPLPLREREEPQAPGEGAYGRTDGKILIRQRLPLIPTLLPQGEKGFSPPTRSPWGGGGWRLRWGAVRRRCAEMMAAYDVRPVAPDLPAARFSGGNQQKLVLAREIEAAPDLLLAGQPTRGVDIGAAAFIHRRLLALRASGKAVLLVSADLDEILALSDRVLVMFDGRIVGETTPAAADDRALGMMMTGAA